METGDFLRSVLGVSGYYCVLALKTLEGGEKKRVQKFYTKIEQVEHSANNFSEEGFDAYFALSTFKDGRTRKSENAEQLRAFYMDLDCGEGKDYPDQPTAITALRAFCKRNGLPKPVLVNSGHGVHVYWPLTEPVSRALWQPIAAKLKALATAQAFRLDPTATEDAARVLRVPGTNNYKNGKVVSVELLTDANPVSFELFSGLLEDVPAQFTVPVRRDLVDPLTEAYINSREYSFKQILQKTANGHGCEQLAYAIGNNSELSEPMWRSALSIAKFCKDGKKAAALVSQDYPGYDEEDTLDKMGRIKGPYLCGTFDENNPGICQSCPNFGKIKTPLLLGGKFKEASAEDNVVSVIEDEGVIQTYNIPDFPKPYFRGANGGVYMRTVDDEGEILEKMVYINDLYVVNRLSDPESGENIVMRLHLPRDGVREFTVPLSIATSKEEFRKALSTNGVAAINKEVDALMLYTQSWVNTLQNAIQADQARRQFGWVDDNFTSFAVGDQLVYGDRIEYNAPSTSTRGLFKAFTQRGSLDAWKRAMNFYNRPGFELHQLIVCAGLGSILMPFTPISACVINLFSKDSGFGKTTAQYASLTHWGSPKSLILSKEDTHNSRMNRMEVLKNLPVCMDEITNIRPMDASDMIYSISGSRQRNRLTSSGNVERFRGEPWSMICITSANCSIIDKISLAKAMPKAEAQRMLEIAVGKKFTAPTDKAETDAFSSSLHENYGHSGILFVQYVINHVEEVRALVNQVQRNIDTAANLGPENRFWSAGIAASIAALLIAKQIGLLNYDVKRLTQFAISDVLVRNQSAASVLDMNTEQIVAEYVYQNWGKILQIKSTADRRGHNRKNENGFDDLVIPEQQPRIDIVGRYETDLKKLYIIPKPFKEWLSEQQLDYNTILGELKRELKAHKARIRITRGTPVVLPAIDTIAMSFDAEGTVNARSEAETEARG